MMTAFQVLYIYVHLFLKIQKLICDPSNEANLCLPARMNNEKDQNDFDLYLLILFYANPLRQTSWISMQSFANSQETNSQSYFFTDKKEHKLYDHYTIVQGQSPSL